MIVKEKGFNHLNLYFNGLKLSFIYQKVLIRKLKILNQ